MESLTTRQMIIISLFTSLTAGLAVVTRLSAGIIPFSLLPMMAMLAGHVLGARLGALSMLLYLILGLIGLPVFASPPFGGLTYFFQPSFGFLIGFIFCACIGGWITSRKADRLERYLLANLAGIIVINLFGLTHLWFLFNFILGQQKALGEILKIGLFPFLLSDLLKGIIACFLGFNINKRIKLY